MNRVTQMVHSQTGKTSITETATYDTFGNLTSIGVEADGGFLDAAVGKELHMVVGEAVDAVAGDDIPEARIVKGQGVDDGLREDEGRASPGRLEVEDALSRTRKVEVVVSPAVVRLP